MWVLLLELHVGGKEYPDIYPVLQEQYSTHTMEWSSILDSIMECNPYSVDIITCQLKTLIDTQNNLALRTQRNRDRSPSLHSPPPPPSSRDPLVFPSSSPDQTQFAKPTLSTSARAKIQARRNALLQLANPPQPDVTATSSRAKAKAVYKDEHLSEDDVPDGVSEASKKPGRFSKALIASIHNLRDKYHADLKALADNSGKSLHSILCAAGDIVKDDRKLNTWNAWQAYATAPEGLDWRKADGQSNNAFKAEISVAYQRICDGPGKEELLRDVLDWYRKQLAIQTQGERNEGLTANKMLRFAEPFINRVSVLLL